MPLDLHLNRLDEWDDAAGLEPTLRRAVRETLAAAGAPEDGELSVTFLASDEMRELSRRYLGEDAATDVLAFDLGEGALLGDVYVAPEVAAVGAASHGASPREELARLVVHGLLHLLGHDHPDGEERYESEMFRLQEEVVGRLDL